MLKKASGNYKAPEELFQNSAENGKYYATSALKDFEPSASCSNESVECNDIISNTSEGDSATPIKDIETGCSTEGPALITKN